MFIFQTLLRHGANPDLRDEDGKTPMDKARERNDEGHREVVHILQSPGQLCRSSQSVSQSVSQAGRSLVNQSVSQPVIQPANQPFSQSVCQSHSESASE